MEYAVDLAKRYSAEIYLLYVISVTPTYFSVPTLSSWSPFPHTLYMAESEDDGEEVLASALNRVRRAGVRSIAWLEHGWPAGRIIQTAKEENVDLIVMRNEKRSLIARLFFGSVSDEVIRNAPCPVLIVNRKTKSSEPNGR